MNYTTRIIIDYKGQKYLAETRLPKKGEIFFFTAPYLFICKANPILINFKNIPQYEFKHVPITCPKIDKTTSYIPIDQVSYIFTLLTKL